MAGPSTFRSPIKTTAFKMPLGEPIGEPGQTSSTEEIFFRLLENGDFRLLEDGDIRVLE